jgi:methyl-accepting chemotaxis protein
MKPSVLNQLLFASLAFGLTVGLIFPFYANFFVTWKDGMYGWFFASCLVAGSLIGAANYWFVNTILVSRLRRIADIAGEISERNLTHTCNIESHDTVGKIIVAFNKMTENLRSLIGNIGAMSGRVEGDTQDIRAQVDEIRTRFTAQHESTKEIARAIEHLTVTASDISTTAEQVAESARGTVGAARSGAQVVAATVAGMNSIQHTVTEASANIDQLGQRSDEIGAIVAVIRGIADQTNLLALNAAIEAARAGEQGRGFAVVADEVRKLAEKTGSATQEIGQMIGAIQSQVKQTVLAMQQNQSEVSSGVDRAEQAGQALADILGGIESVSTMMERIAAGAADQRATVGEIGRQVSAIESGIDSALERTRMAEASCQHLAEQSATLHTEVGRFRLS